MCNYNGHERINKSSLLSYTDQVLSPNDLNDYFDQFIASQLPQHTASTLSASRCCWWQWRWAAAAPWQPAGIKLFPYDHSWRRSKHGSTKPPLPRGSQSGKIGQQRVSCTKPGNKSWVSKTVWNCTLQLYYCFNSMKEEKLISLKRRWQKWSYVKNVRIMFFFSFFKFYVYIYMERERH